MPRWKYDVFVSFRGKYIRKSFIDHLFKDFKQNGIHAFRDNIELPRGEEISSHLYKAIENSRFLMVIFSKNYASSSWCLRELVKILNSKQMEKPKHEVRILFYDVKPEVVRKQTESYEQAFAKHEVSNRAEVDKWREALSMAANLSGWDLHDMTNGYESKFIDSISKEIRKTLCDGPLHVGVDARVNKLNFLRFLGSSKVNMIGICGISGIGKTTLAKAIYNSMYAYFEATCFCEDVQGVTKRKGLTQVQMQLINKIMKTEDVKISNISEGIMVIKQRVACEPILLVLDDVDHHEQLEALAGSCQWFCPGSLIIFTGKDKQLLRSHRVDEIYEMEFLDAREDIKLFRLYAFGQTHPTHDFNDLAYQVVKCLQGHPLALKVVGNALFGKSARVWRSELDRLQMYPNSEIQQKLRPSFDLLDFDQKRIFLDIACSLIGENIDVAASVLDSINCFADSNIDVLRTVNKAVEVWVLLLEKSPKKVYIDSKAFANMKKLRILKICHSEPTDFSVNLSGSLDFLSNELRLIYWHGYPFNFLPSNFYPENVVVIDLSHSNIKSFWTKPKICHPDLKDYGHSGPTDFSVNFSGSMDFLSNELRLIYWHGYPFNFLPSSFYPENVVVIDLSYSNIKSFWTTPKCFKRLKVMKLSHCRSLTTTPDFTEMTNLEVLTLEGCVSLVELHPSIGMLEKLVVLNMRDCRSFPFKVEMDNLTQVSGTLKTLVTLVKLWFPCTWWTSIFQKQPQSLVLPSLASLRSLSLRNCNISEVCHDIGALPCLERLDLSGNNFTNLPRSLSQLFHLKSLYLNSCKKLEVSPELPPNIEDLYASQCITLQEPPRLIHQHLHLQCDFRDCPKLFGNVSSIDRQVSISQTGVMDSSTTSHAFTNQYSLLVEYLGMESRIRELFSGSGGSSCKYKILDIRYNGNRIIPGWFRNKSKGNDVKVELPPNWCNNSNFKGFGFCLVFKPKGSYMGVPGYSVNNFDGAQIDGHDLHYLDRLQIRDTDDTMIWLFFKACNWRGEEAKNFVTFTFGDKNKNYEVKGCGVRLVCEDDEETVLSMIQHLPPQTLPTTGFFWLTDGGGFTSLSW